MKYLWVALAILGVTIAVSGVTVSGDESVPKRPREVDFTKEIVPIFEAKCIHCHGAKRKGGGLDMRTVAALQQGGVSGPAYKPGDAEKSLMVDLIHFNEMPPKKDKTPRVTKEELGILKAWIAAEKP